MALVNYLRTMELSLALKFLDFLGEVALVVVLALEGLKQEDLHGVEASLNYRVSSRSICTVSRKK